MNELRRSDEQLKLIDEPGGGDGAWRDDIKPALDNLMARILERDNVKRAWERVKSNQGRPAVTG
jgi:RNA-directed DNA polymerase